VRDGRPIAEGRGVRGALSELRERFRGVVLLAGAARESRFVRSVGRSALDLPVRDGSSILDVWGRSCAALADAMGVPEVSVRVLVSRESRRPTLGASWARVRASVEEDRHALRGTGGVLRDVASDYAPHDQLLVCNANQVVLEPLETLVAALAESRGAVRFLATLEGTPIGIKLFEVRALMGIKAVGYVDLKEQAMPALAKSHEVRVVRRGESHVYPVRSLSDYVHAARYANSRDAMIDETPFAEDWFETFRLVEPGAAVDASARIHDSVVLRGATVGAGAVVVRSVVCEGASVAAGQIVGDRVVPGSPGRAREVGA
jgi:mannose-1-phosphate guanylyltransferase